MFKYSSVPAYSMGPKPPPDHLNMNPGPGNYELESGMVAKSITHPNDPTCKFSRNPRLQKYGNENPGPGQYESPHDRKVKGGYVGARSAEFKGMMVPGPGSYDPNSIAYKQPKAPAYTMSNRGKMTMNFRAPGPGSYDPNEDISYPRNFSGKI